MTTREKLALAGRIAWSGFTAVLFYSVARSCDDLELENAVLREQLDERNRFILELRQDRDMLREKLEGQGQPA